MTFIVYEPLTENGDFSDVKVLDFVEAESYSYKKHMYEIGKFTLTVPNTVNGIKTIQPDMLLLVLDDYVNDSLVITSVKSDDEHTTLSGYDLKYLLAWRITLFPPAEILAGTYGYDVATGTTGQIIEHYIDYNMGESADEDRQIYGIAFGDIATGIADDTYMSRMQPVNEVVEALCKNADIGYSVDIVREGETTGYVVTVFEGVDRTEGQSANSKMVFADYTFSAESITAETNTEERKNLIWAINGGTVDEATVTAVNNSGEVDDPAGFARRETVTTVNCDIEDVEIYAKKDMDGNVDKTEINVQASIYSDYGTRYNVGDKVTSIKNGAGYDRRVLSVEKMYSGSNRKVAVTLGEIPERKVIKRLNYQTEKNKQEVINQRLDGPAGSSGGVGEDIGNHSERFNDYTDNEQAARDSWLHIEGKNNKALGGNMGGNYCTHMDGEGNRITNCKWSDIHGNMNTVSNYAYYVTLSGSENEIVSGSWLAVSGYDNTITNSNGSTAGGQHNTLNGADSSIVAGEYNTVSGDYDVVVGYNNTVTTHYALVGGQWNTVSGSWGLTVGQGNLNNTTNCGMFGQYGEASSDERLVVGNGSGTNNRSKCFYVNSIGEVYASGGYHAIGADYAEYFEWADGNPDGEDRRGMLVQLIGDKIAPAHGDDILGAVSSRPSVIGNAYEEHWRGKYKTDIYGDYILGKDGKPELSDDYDPERKYIPRSKRPEWSPVGLIGRLIIRDNGKCEPGGYVSARQGVGVPTFKETRARCIRRIDALHIEILVR